MTATTAPSMEMAGDLLDGLQKLLADPRATVRGSSFDEAAGSALVCLAKALGYLPAPLAEYALNIIFQNTPRLSKAESDRVLGACARLPDSDSDVVRQAIDLGNANARQTVSAQTGLDGLPQLNQSTTLILQEARRRGIQVRILDEKKATYELSHGGITHTCSISRPSVTGDFARDASNSKTVASKIASDTGIKVPAEFFVSGSAKGVSKFADEHPRMVLKPAYGWGGRGVSVDIDKSGLKAALQYAVKQSGAISNRYGSEAAKKIVIQEFVPGHNLRVTLIGYKVIGAALRRPASITGDGISTVKQLIDIWNTRHATTGNGSYLPDDGETRRCLARNNLEPDSVLEDGRTVVASRTT